MQTAAENLPCEFPNAAYAVVGFGNRVTRAVNSAATMLRGIRTRELLGRTARASLPVSGDPTSVSDLMFVDHVCGSVVFDLDDAEARRMAHAFADQLAAQGSAILALGVSFDPGLPEMPARRGRRGPIPIALLPPKGTTEEIAMMIAALTMPMTCRGLIGVDARDVCAAFAHADVGYATLAMASGQTPPAAAGRAAAAALRQRGLRRNQTRGLLTSILAGPDWSLLEIDDAATAACSCGIQEAAVAVVAATQDAQVASPVIVIAAGTDRA